MVKPPGFGLDFFAFLGIWAENSTQISQKYMEDDPTQ